MLNFVKANISAEPRLEVFENQEHVVVPVVMAIVNVGMNGAEIPVDEMMPESWNGTLVTIGHPKDDGGRYISANDSPAVLEAWGVGRLFHVELTENGRLRGEAYINTSKVDRELVEALRNREAQIDVSTAYFSEVQDGYYRDIKPDHLALLPGERGACSWDDGCGVRANQKRGLSMQIMEAFNVIKGALGMGVEGPKVEVTELTTNKLTDVFGAHYQAMGYREIMERVQSQLDALDSGIAVHYLVDLFDDYFVYQARPGAESGESEPRFYRRGYSVGDDGRVVMGADVVEVMKTVSYDPVTNQKQETEGEQMSEEAGGRNNGEEVQGGEVKTNRQAGDCPEKDQVLTNEDREALAHARKVHAEHRQGLVDKITANSSMTAEQCGEMETKTLETVAAGLKPQGDYSGRPFPVSNEDGGEDQEKNVVEAMTPPTTAEVFKSRSKAH